MEYLVTAAEMKQYDRNTIEKIGIPGMVLMERAAYEVFRIIEARFGKFSAGRKRVFILAGVGNNGGDGLAIGRILCEAGYSVSICCIGNADKATDQWKQQMEILKHFPVHFCSRPEQQEYTVMVDALFGVGLCREVDGIFAEAIDNFNEAEGVKIAIDIPSGIDSDTGMVCGKAVKADITVTFGFYKRGLVFFPGSDYAGEVIKVPVGITPNSFFDVPPKMFFYDEEPSFLMPKRVPDGNKGTFGKVLLVAGSVNMAGAAILSAKAAYRIGAGMVKLISPEENRVIIQEMLPEALYGTYRILEESMKWADVIAVGPGLGMADEAYMCLKKVLCESKVPLIIDADGLNLLSKDVVLFEEVQRQCADGRQMIFTPHIGELSRLLKVPIGELKKDIITYSKGLAKTTHAVIVAKDARTVVCREKGTFYVNVSGNSGMATAGSGDVLTGMIAGLTAQGMDLFTAATVGVYLHGKAGDLAAAEVGEHGCMAGDITAYFRWN